MPDAWSLLKRIGKKKIDQRKESAQRRGSERIDKDLPLVARETAG